jgi:hypothetical protein
LGSLATLTSPAVDILCVAGLGGWGWINFLLEGNMNF